MGCVCSAGAIQLGIQPCARVQPIVLALLLLTQPTKSIVSWETMRSELSKGEVGAL